MLKELYQSFRAANYWSHKFAMLFSAGAVIVFCSSASSVACAQPTAKVGRYVLQSNPWVNLHQRLLYEARFKAASPAALSSEDLATWKKAVETYRVFLGNRNPIVDNELRQLNENLSKTGNSMFPASIPAAASAALKIAMPLYRAAQWNEDDRTNRFWISVAEPMLTSAAEELIAAHEKVYGVPFPKNIMVDVSSVAWEFGAYTVPLRGSAHVVIASTDRGSQGFAALEALMHEPTHAIAALASGAIGDDLTRISKQLGVKPRPFLWHMIVFYTSGELTRHALAKRGVSHYRPAVHGMYEIGFSEYKQPLETHWQAYLDEKISRDEAIRQILSDMAKSEKTSVSQLQSSVAGPRSSPIFVFNADEFWLNLHHFLYVLGRAENKEANATREAVVHAPGDQERGMKKLAEKEQKVWREAVTAYAAGPSKKDLIFDDPLPALSNALAQAGERPSLAGLNIDPAFATILERAAPVYRKAWWSEHRDANRSWKKSIQELVDRHGATVLAFITNAYKMEWPRDGFAVHISAYTNWAGAYSTSGNLLVVSSLSADLKDWYGLETVFHEGMHQWDSQVFQALREEARKSNSLVPRDLSHAMIFFTAGEAIRRVVPGHIPYAEKFGVWKRGIAPFKAAVEQVWKPYLDGRGTREEAFAEMIRRLHLPRGGTPK